MARKDKKKKTGRETPVANKQGDAAKRGNVRGGATGDRKPSSAKPVQAVLIVPEDKAKKIREQFPEEFPFWARIRIDKYRTTLVIDEAIAQDKEGNPVDGYVHREAIHPSKKNEKYILSGDYEVIKPNPDKDDPRPMCLKRPRKLPKYLFRPHNKKLDMPEDLRKRYEKNNKKDK